MCLCGRRSQSVKDVQQPNGDRGCGGGEPVTDCETAMVLIESNEVKGGVRHGVRPKPGPSAGCMRRDATDTEDALSPGQRRRWETTRRR